MTKVDIAILVLFIIYLASDIEMPETIAAYIDSPIGMVGVQGDFSRGDVIAILDGAGYEVARGLANYASAEAKLLCSKPSSVFESLLGYAAEPEMVHRTNLVLTSSSR